MDNTITRAASSAQHSDAVMMAPDTRASTAPCEARSCHQHPACPDATESATFKGPLVRYMKGGEKADTWRRRYTAVFWTTELMNQRTYSSTTRTQMRGTMIEALDRIPRSIMPVPSKRGASRGRETCHRVPPSSANVTLSPYATEKQGSKWQGSPLCASDYHGRRPTWLASSPPWVARSASMAGSLKLHCACRKRMCSRKTS